MTGPDRESGLPLSTDRRIRVLLIDDHPIVRLGLRTLLASEPKFEICGEAESVVDACGAIERTRPDLIVLDLRLRDGDGLSVMGTILHLPNPPRILIVSAQAEEVCAEQALQAGANGYLTKQDAAEQLIAAVRKVAAGELYLSEQFRTRRTQEYRAKRTTDSARAGLQALSPREFTVFKLIGEGFSTREIAGKMELSIKTIDTYREHLKTKLSHASGSDLVQHAIQIGRLGWVTLQPD